MEGCVCDVTKLGLQRYVARLVYGDDVSDADFDALFVRQPVQCAQHPNMHDCGVYSTRYATQLWCHGNIVDVSDVEALVCALQEG